MNAVPHCCPVCEGARWVHRSLYHPAYPIHPDNPAWNPADIVACQSCDGAGVVWFIHVPDEPSIDLQNRMGKLHGDN